MTLERTGHAKVLCGHCDVVLDVAVPRVGEDMNSAALEDFGRAIIEARLLHAMLDCPAMIEEADR